METNDRIREKCYKIGFIYENLKETTQNYLKAIEEHIVGKEKKRDEALRILDELPFTVVSVSNNVNCSRTTMYKDGQVLKKYVELSSEEFEDSLPKANIEKLKTANRILKERVALMENRDVDIEMLKHELHILKGKLKERDTELDRLRNTIARINNEKKKQGNKSNNIVSEVYILDDYIEKK